MNQYKRALELVSLIYEAALDLDLWHTLLEDLHHNIESHSASSVIDRKQGKVLPFQNRNSSPDAQPVVNIEQEVSLISQSSRSYVANTGVQSLVAEIAPLSEDELQLTELLLPHFERAMKLNREIFQMRQEREVVLSLLGQLPVGVLLLRRDSSIVASNELAKQILARADGVREENGHLKLARHQEQNRLTCMVDAAMERKQSDSDLKVDVTTITRDSCDLPLSLLVTPFSGTGKINTDSDMVALIINDPEFRQEINESLLIATYKLTTAEARLVRGLVDGLNIEAIANKYNVSKNTLRSQLKVIFEKTGTHRQAELVRLVLTGPSSLRGIDQSNNEQLTTESAQNSNLMESESACGIRLKDGRWLAYAEYGNPQGQPVLFCHCIISCRLQQIPIHRLAKKLGLRIIIPDRPGFGLSNPKQKISLLKWCDDVNELTKKLQIDVFDVIGNLGGGPYALACASIFSEHIRSVTVINSLAPIDTLDELSGMLPMNKMLFKMAKANPRVLSVFTKIMVAGLRRNPLQYIKRVIDFAPSQDGVFLDDEHYFRGTNYAFKESTRQGGEALAQELVLLMNPWGFQLDDIEKRVDIWHAEDNRHITPYMSQKLHALLPNSQLYLLENQGRFMSTSVWSDILARIAGRD